MPDRDDTAKYALGKKNLAVLSGIPDDAPASGYAMFAPVTDKFLKEHLFADIFDRDILSWKNRELATVSVITGVGGVEPMGAAHMGICLHQDLTPDHLSALLNIIELPLQPDIYMVLLIMSVKEMECLAILEALFILFHFLLCATEYIQRAPCHSTSRQNRFGLLLWIYGGESVATHLPSAYHHTPFRS